MCCGSGSDPALAEGAHRLMQSAGNMTYVTRFWPRRIRLWDFLRKRSNARDLARQQNRDKRGRISSHAQSHRQRPVPGSHCRGLSAFASPRAASCEPPLDPTPAAYAGNGAGDDCPPPILPTSHAVLFVHPRERGDPVGDSPEEERDGSGVGHGTGTRPSFHICSTSARSCLPLDSRVRGNERRVGEGSKQKRPTRQHRPSPRPKVTASIAG